MKIIGVYKITNKINGKCYIGKSIDIKARFSDHKKPSNLKSHYKIYKAFVKYGVENFNFEVLSKCPKEYLDKLKAGTEQKSFHYIKRRIDRFFYETKIVRKGNRKYRRQLKDNLEDLYGERKRPHNK